MKTDYIHGFDPGEQERLRAQARYLEPMVFEGVAYPKGARIIEAGCGVGAQTEILLRRFPDARIDAFDLSPEQIAVARRRLKRAVETGRATFAVGDATRLDVPSRRYDGAFLCWVLEHVPRPAAVLKQLRRALKPGAVIHGIEVMNSSLVFEPAFPALRRYWDIFNQRQRALGGDPDVGARMGNLLHEAGFTDIRTAPYGRHYDQRDRRAFAVMIDYWERLMASGAAELLKAGATNRRGLAELKTGFARMRRSPRGLFYYSPIKYSARVPSR